MPRGRHSRPSKTAKVIAAGTSAATGAAVSGAIVVTGHTAVLAAVTPVSHAVQAPVIQVPEMQIEKAEIAAAQAQYRQAVSAAEQHEWHLRHLAHLAHVASLDRESYSQPTVTVSVQQPASQPAQGGSIISDVYAVFGSGESCAVEILDHESGTSPQDVYATNPGSDAYGLPQALPGDKMASAGADWQSNPFTQLRWMKGYVDSVYGGVCNAAYHDLSTGTY